MEEAPRYASLRDYLGVLRRHRLLIILVTIGFTAAALLISKAQHKKFDATALLQAHDICQDAALVGKECAVQLPAPARAASLAQEVSSPGIAKEVQKDLKKKNGVVLPIVRLQDAVAGAVQQGTLNVSITATTTTPKLAPQIANAYAHELKSHQEADTQAQLHRVEKALNSQIQTFAKSSDPRDQLQKFVLEGKLSGVKTLEGIAQPVTFSQHATEPSGPSSPDTKRNVVLGFIVGLFFGLLGAFLRDSLDRRLHSIADIHRELALPVLGRVPDTALGFPGLAVNGRVSMNETDFEAFRILRTNLGALGTENAPRSVMITSGLPEEGKSTVSMSLASAAALAGQRVLLVECDLRRPSFSQRLKVKREPGLTDYLLGKATPQDVLQTVDLREPATFANGSFKRRSDRPVATLVVIAAGSAVANPAELLISERFKEFLAKVTKAYDMVILDSSPVLAVADPLELIGQVDAALVCVRAQHATREEARATRAALSHVPDRPMGVVVTGLRRGGDSYEYYYYGE
jgi:capsular exopolysaccharide synthesis family protein